jgi:hypothetical protein
VDGVLQLGGRGATVVYPGPNRRGYSFVVPFRGTAQHALWSTPTICPLFELASCHRTGTVEEYQDRFQALLARAGTLKEQQRVQLFTGGLLPPLSLEVQVHNPQSLAAAMSLTRQLELREQYTRSPAKNVGRGLHPAPPPRLALPAPPLDRDKAASAVPGDGHLVKRLSQAEQEERRRLGLCYNCDNKYTRGHN